MFKLELEEDGYRCYEGLGYQVEQRFYGIRGLFGLTINPISEESWLPRIYARQDKLFRVIGFEIQTTSWGSLNSKDMKEVVKGYQAALIVVEMLEKLFLEKQAD